MTLEPSQFHPGAFDIVDGEQHTTTKRIRSNTVPLELLAKRVDDPEFPRLYVPGEKQRWILRQACSAALVCRA